MARKKNSGNEQLIGGLPVDGFGSPALMTAAQESPAQMVMEFFKSGVPITDTPKDVAFKKSNAAIRLKGANWGRMEKKIINACIYIARPNMLAERAHVADIDYFKWLLNFNSKNHDHLKQAFENIQKTLVQMNIVDQKDAARDIWHSTHFLTDVTMTSRAIYFRIPESIRQPLLEPKSWTLLSFRTLNRFSSDYAYTLYEEARSHLYKNATPWYTIDEFRDMMSLRQPDGSEFYKLFQDLQKRVIKPAVDQINQHSDIFLTPDFRRTGRFISHICFHVEVNPNLEMMEFDKEKVPPDVFLVLKNEFGFSNSGIDEVATYPLDFLTEKIEFAQYRIAQKKQKGEKIDRPDLYLNRALTEDFRLTPEEKANAKSFIEEARKLKPIAKKKTVIQENKPLSKVAESDHETRVPKQNEWFEAFKGMGESEREALIADFKKSPFFSSFLKSKFSGKNFDVENIFIKTEFIKFLESMGK